EAFSHERVHNNFRPDVGRAVGGRVRPEPDAAEEEVVETRRARLHLLLLHLELALLRAGLDLLLDQPLLAEAQLLHLRLQVLLLRADLFLLLGDLRLQDVESLLQLELPGPAADRLRVIDLLPLRLEQPLPVHEVLLPPEELLLLVPEGLLHLLLLLDGLLLLPPELLREPLPQLLPAATALRGAAAGRVLDLCLLGPQGGLLLDEGEFAVLQLTELHGLAEEVFLDLRL